MVMVEQMDENMLTDLVRRSDRLGILSVYLNADPGSDPHLQAAAIDLKNRFRELQRRMAENAGPARKREITAALERVWPQVESLAGPEASGRGRVLLVALDSDWDLRLESAMPVADNRVVLDNRPFIHPLLELLDEGRAAGVVVASADQARILEWRLGSLHLIDRLEAEDLEAPHERSGQIGGGPEGQFHSPMREQRQARNRDRAQKFLDRVVQTAANLAAERGWERLLVSAGERMTRSIIAAFPEPLRGSVFGDPRILGGLDDAALAAAVSKRVRQQHTERERQLVCDVSEAGRSGSGALGLSEVVAALNAGRVAHLVYDPEIRHVGSAGPDGTLYAGDEGPADAQVSPDPRLTERIIERALATGALVTPVEGAAQSELRESAGVAALLRW